MKLIWLAKPNKEISGQHIFRGLLDNEDIKVLICFKKNSPHFGKQDSIVFNLPNKA